MELATCVSGDGAWNWQAAAEAVCIDERRRRGDCCWSRGQRHDRSITEPVATQCVQTARTGDVAVC